MLALFPGTANSCINIKYLMRYNYFSSEKSEENEGIMKKIIRMTLKCEMKVILGVEQ